MFKNYFKIALRNLLKNKTYLVINSLGMGVAIACCMAAYLLVAFNIEFNSYFNEDDTAKITKVLTHLEHQNGEPYQNLVAPLVMGPIAAESITGIKQFARFGGDGASLSRGDKVFFEYISFTDSSFFQLFDFELVKGSFQNFKNLQSIYLSEELADKYFVDEDPINKTLTLNLRGKEHEVFVVYSLYRILYVTGLSVNFHGEHMYHST